MNRMFHGQAWNGGTSAFNQPIGDWDASKVTNMEQMFKYTKAFNQPIGGWDTSQVTDMYYMFQNAKAFNQDISGWNLSSGRSVRTGGMFSGADAYNAAKAEAEAKAKAAAEAEAAAESEFMLIDEGSCESVGMVTIMDEETCKKAGAVVDNSPGKPVKVVTNRIDRPKGCVLHNFQKGSANKPTELFLGGYLDGCEKGGYDCVCIKPAVAAAEAAKPEPFADSAALKTAVDNCLRAVPSGLDCCKPKSEGGGGADCGAGKHAAIGDWDTSKVTSMRTLFSEAKSVQSTDRRLGYLQGHRHDAMFHARGVQSTNRELGHLQGHHHDVHVHNARVVQSTDRELGYLQGH